MSDESAAVLARFREYMVGPTRFMNLLSCFELGLFDALRGNQGSGMTASQIGAATGVTAHAVEQMFELMVREDFVSRDEATETYALAGIGAIADEEFARTTGLNILSAQIFTRTDGIALDTFFVNDARTGNLAAREQHDKFAALLEKVLNGEEVDLPALIARQITNRPVYHAYAGEQMATEIHFDNEASEERTLLEIETEDQLGLLYAISQTFFELAVDIAGARIVTERGAAIDSFYVRELAGGKIVSLERHRFIETHLRNAISQFVAVLGRRDGGQRPDRNVCQRAPRLIETDCSEQAGVVQW